MELSITKKITLCFLAFACLTQTLFCTTEEYLQLALDQSLTKFGEPCATSPFAMGFMFATKPEDPENPFPEISEIEAIYNSLLVDNSNPALLDFTDGFLHGHGMLFTHDNHGGTLIRKKHGLAATIPDAAVSTCETKYLAGKNAWKGDSDIPKLVEIALNNVLAPSTATTEINVRLGSIAYAAGFRSACTLAMHQSTTSDTEQKSLLTDSHHIRKHLYARTICEYLKDKQTQELEALKQKQAELEKQIAELTKQLLKKSNARNSKILAEKRAIEEQQKALRDRLKALAKDPDRPRTIAPTKRTTEEQAVIEERLIAAAAMFATEELQEKELARQATELKRMQQEEKRQRKCDKALRRYHTALRKAGQDTVSLTTLPSAIPLPAPEDVSGTVTAPLTVDVVNILAQPPEEDEALLSSTDGDASDSETTTLRSDDDIEPDSFAETSSTATGSSGYDEPTSSEVGFVPPLPILPPPSPYGDGFRIGIKTILYSPARSLHHLINNMLIHTYGMIQIINGNIEAETRITGTFNVTHNANLAYWTGIFNGVCATQALLTQYYQYGFAAGERNDNTAQQSIIGHIASTTRRHECDHLKARLTLKNQFDAGFTQGRAAVLTV